MVTNRISYFGTNGTPRIIDYKCDHLKSKSHASFSSVKSAYKTSLGTDESHVKFTL